MTAATQSSREPIAAPAEQPDRRLRLGLAWNFSISRQDAEHIARIYGEIVETIVYAEELGIDSFWLAQHHFDGQPGALPSPFILLTLAATRTKRIALGTGITILPLEDPIRLAEDAAVLDLVAAGRLQLGLSTGGANSRAFTAFGLDFAQRREIFQERLARFRAALTGEPLVDGADGPRISPPGAALNSRIWQGASTIPWAESVARAGDGIQLGSFTDPADTGQRPKIEAYKRQWEAAGHAGDPRVAVFRFLYLGDDRSSVLVRTEPVLTPRLERLGQVAAEHGNPAIARFTSRDFLEKIAFYGNPEDIANQFRSDPTNPAQTATDFVVNFNNGVDFDFELHRSQLQALAKEIGPRVGWAPAL